MPERILPRYGVAVVDNRQLITQEWRATLENIFSRLMNVEERQSVLNSIDQTVNDLQDAVSFLQTGSTPEAPATPSISDSPVGIIAAYAAGTPPMGWLLCDGAAVSRTAYASLFQAIGTIWGAGDGSTTFNVPDGQARFFIGKGGAFNVGNVGGSLSASLAHTHTVTVPDVIVMAGVGTTVGQSGTFTSTSSLGATDITPPYFTGIWMIRY